MTKLEEYPHVQAAFINVIREGGSKDEACDYLQKFWNKSCALEDRVEELEAALKSAIAVLEHYNPELAKQVLATTKDHQS